MKAILVGILASLFFAVTFVLNRAMELSGGSWYWSASLRFLLFIVMMGEINASFKRNAQTPVVLAQVEFCRLCAFLRTDNFCRCIRTGMADSRDMADYHCGRCAFIPFLL